MLGRNLFSVLATIVLAWCSTTSAASTSLGLRCDRIFIGQASGISSDKSLARATSLELVINETLTQRGHFTSRYQVTHSEALHLGLIWLGEVYSEIGQSSSGVFLNREGTKRFRLDPRSLDGAHSPGQPHVHLELINPLTQEVLSNNHILLIHE